MSSTSPLLSVVLPAFNSANYLAQAIDSILSQTVKSFELLVIYDESSDATREIIEGYAAQDERVRLIEGQKARLVGALNQGLSLAKGQYIARMDSDDISLPTRFERQIEYMEQEGLDFCGSDMLMINALGSPLREIAMPSTPDLIAVTLACTVPFAHGSVVMRKSFLDRHNLIYRQRAIAEDYVLWCEAYKKNAHFGNVNEILFYYRHFPDSLSKVHAKAVYEQTKELRRKFVRENIKMIEGALTCLLPVQKELSTRDEGFLLLCAYLLYQQNKSPLSLLVLKNARLKSIAITIAKIIRGF
jgi:glycosyltransferase involved in cell wall biosynthesis